MNAEALQEAKNSPYCPECKKLYSSNEDEIPKLLSRCEHTFCRKCLIRLKSGTKIMCPLDYLTTECDYVSQLQLNQTLLALAGKTVNQNNATAKKNELPTNITANSIIPVNFCGVNDYVVEASKANFQITEISIRGNMRKVLCLKSSQEAPNKLVDANINPIDLEALLPDYYPTLERTRFCWRWAAIQNSNYRIITIEDDASIVNPLVKAYNNISPSSLKVDQEFEDEASELYFYWRWGELNGVTYRILTLEY